MLARGCAWLVAGAVLTGTGRSAAEEGKSPAELQGTWKLVSVEAEGMAVEIGDRSPRLVIKGDSIHYGGREIAKVAADGTTRPRLFDLKLIDRDGVCEGIYVVEKDTLKVCLNKQAEGVKDRPGEFTTKDKQDWRLLVFERDKNGDPSEGLSGFVGVMLKYDEPNKQVIVVDALEDSPARKAGLKKDDVLVGVAGAAVKDLQSTVETVRRSKPRDNLVFRVSRGGKEVDVTVKVGVLPFTVITRLN